MRLTQLRTSRPFQREVLERHARLFAYLERGESEIDVERQRFRTSLIENRSSAVAIGKLAEAPDQFLTFSARTNRIAQRDPASTIHLIHHEGIGGLVEKQAFVAGQRG